MNMRYNIIIVKLIENFLFYFDTVDDLMHRFDCDRNSENDIYTKDAK